MVLAGATGTIFAMGVPAKVASVSTKDDNVEKNSHCLSCKNGDPIRATRVHCDLCDGWNREVCSWLSLPLLTKLSEMKAMYLLFRCKPCFDKSVVGKISRKKNQDTSQKFLLRTVKTALVEINLSDLYEAVSELKGGIKVLRRN